MEILLSILVGVVIGAAMVGVCNSENNTDRKIKEMEKDIEEIRKDIRDIKWKIEIKDDPILDILRLKNYFYDRFPLR